MLRSWNYLNCWNWWKSYIHMLAHMDCMFISNKNKNVSQIHSCFLSFYFLICFRWNKRRTITKNKLLCSFFPRRRQWITYCFATYCSNRILRHMSFIYLLIFSYANTECIHFTEELWFILFYSVFFFRFHTLCLLLSTVLSSQQLPMFIHWVSRSGCNQAEKL